MDTSKDDQRWSDEAEKGRARQDEQIGSSKPVGFDAQAIDVAMEARVRRKLDLHLVPLVAALYLFAFLDRSNIGYVCYV